MKNKIIKFTIDTDVINEYNKYYFLRHPRAKKPPITSPHHPSLNSWTSMLLEQKNVLKQKWSDFIIWYMRKIGYADMCIDKCEMEITTYFKDSRVRDIDNYMSQKFIFDGFVNANFITHDDYKHLTKLTLSCGKDKDNPRTEYIVKILD